MAAKQLSQSDIAHKAERWATLKKKIAEAEAARDKKLEPIISACERKVEAVSLEHTPAIEALQAKADLLAGEINGWLDKQKRSVKVEAKHAIAEIVHGSKLSDRKIDLKKFTALCKKKAVDVWDIASIMIGKAEDLLGKKEVDAISTREPIPTKTVTLRLKIYEGRRRVGLDSSVGKLVRGPSEGSKN